MALNALRKSVSTSETELKRWRKAFESNAKKEVNGQKYLDIETFVNAIALKDDLEKIDRTQYAILFKVADSSRRGLVSWDDFVVFETMLKRPDADYWMAFKYFDVDWVKLYLGKRDGAHVLGCELKALNLHGPVIDETNSKDNEFTQLMKGLQGERLRQAFKYLDDNQDGFIRPEQFRRIIVELAGHKLSDAVIERLPTLCTISPGGRISYSEVVAFQNVLREMDMAERIIREATAKSKDGRIDQVDFLNHVASSTRYGIFSPMEASIIFHFAGRGNGNQRLALVDFAQLLDPRWQPPADVFAKPAVSDAMSFFKELAHSTYNFCLGGIAGSLGATIVYPIDLGPQLVGVAPEKAIKLTVNDLVRSKAMDPETGRIKLIWEVVAGGMAGGCQVLDQPYPDLYESLGDSIRLQVQGEVAKAEGAVPKGAIHIVKQLGLLGLYRGASACLLRDIPFSAIYFPAYSHIKKDVFHEGYNGKKLGFLETLTSAAVAGMPAAYLATPADVVKTRLQVEARKGQTNYKGLTDAFIRIYREEGFSALFKGGPARVLRSSPQFGFTLVAYEYLHKFLPFPWNEQPRQLETRLTAQDSDLSRIRARNALKILLDVHSDFGRRSTTS
ncbi:hypothetical protein Clacol_007484 [Clathrus columnatus]|uniref:EF-hand domain-containing protein n=1 Tax=Clathrus columnatus TaxID=1419009 RepID=A0AAV5AI92_9AGAM|nr:hypothetical protein Clacol_007484 [Clathrus columnatus]